MDKIKTIKPIINKYLFPISLATFIFACILFLLIGFSNLNSQFMPLITGLITLFIKVFIFAIMPILFLLKKEDYAQKAFSFVSIYWFLERLLSALNSAGRIIKTTKGLTLAFCVFEFFISLTLIAFLTFFILFIVKKNNKFLNLSYLILMGILLLSFITCILVFARYSSFKNVYTWSDYLNALVTYVILPIAMASTFLHFSFKYELSLEMDNITDENIVISNDDNNIEQF